MPVLWEIPNQAGKGEGSWGGGSTLQPSAQVKLGRALTGRGRGGKVKPTSHSGEAAWPWSQSSPCVQRGQRLSLVPSLQGCKSSPFPMFFGWQHRVQWPHPGFPALRWATASAAMACLGGCQQGGAGCLARTFLLLLGILLAPQQTADPPLLLRPPTLTALGCRPWSFLLGQEMPSTNGLCPEKLLLAGRSAADSWRRPGRQDPCLLEGDPHCQSKGPWKKG